MFVPSNEAVDKLRDGRLIYLFTEVRAYSTLRHPELTVAVGCTGMVCATCLMIAEGCSSQAWLSHICF